MRSFKVLALLAVVAFSVNATAQGKKKSSKPAPAKAEAPAAAPAKHEEAPAPAPVKHEAKKESMHDKFSGQGYGTAGCGLGSIVFGAKPGIIQVIAATLNGTAGSQTFGITTGTSNCDIPEMGHQAAVFIETNKEIVKKDAARGAGETVVTLSEILNCKDANLFSHKLQQNYENIFDNNNSTFESTRRILNTIKTDKELAATCDLIG